jgi:hypothetical protein
MIPTFTQEDLILYYYKELSDEKNEAMQIALKSDRKLHNQYQQLLVLMAKLDTTKLEPSAGTLDRIMEFAKHQHPELQ